MNGPIPTLIWCYPESFKSVSAASQLRDSPFRFNAMPRSAIPLLVAAGIAVLAGPTMPIVALNSSSANDENNDSNDSDDEPNDTYTEQLMSAARSAINQLIDKGIANVEYEEDNDNGKRRRGRVTNVAIGGHSYGAFTAANLIAHNYSYTHRGNDDSDHNDSSAVDLTNLFNCCIARSGAYNRTLTPFGFQSESRTFWEATKTYTAMDPFQKANRIKAPVLLIHGEQGIRAITIDHNNYNDKNVLHRITFAF